MVIKPDVVYNAYNSLENKKQKVIWRRHKEKWTKVKYELAKMVILCGHYEA